MPSLRSDLYVWTFIVYAPQSVPGEVAAKSRRTIFGVKNDSQGFFPGESMIQFVARRVSEESAQGAFGDLFGPDVVLVPVPGCAPLVSKNQLWPSWSLCQQMVQCGLASSAIQLVERVKAVPRSSRVPAGAARPTAAVHAESMSVAPKLLDRPSKLLLVDDVLTRGATMLGAATALQEGYPDSSVMGFAVGRTDRDVEGLASPLRPRAYHVRRVGVDDSNCFAATDSSMSCWPSEGL